MQKEYKKLFWFSLGVFVLGALGAGVLTYRLDPCNVYAFRNEYQACSERYVNAGRINHFVYDSDEADSIVAGSSVASNFTGPEIRSGLGWEKPLRLFIYGFYPGEMDEMLRYALRSGKIKKVLLGIDIDRYDTNDASQAWFDETIFPRFLYNRSFADDWKYLISKQSLKKMWEQQRQKRLIRKNYPLTRDMDFHSFWEADPIGPRRVYEFSRDFMTSKKPPLNKWRPSDKTFVLADKYLAGLARDFPDVDFYYFFPPYPYNRLTENYLDLRAHLVHETAELKNVFLSDFTGWKNIPLNSAYYRDIGHYNAGINAAMLKAIKRSEERLTEQNLAERQEKLMQALSNPVYTADFDSTVAEPPAYRTENTILQTDGASVSVSTGKQKFEFAKTYVIAADIAVPADGTAVFAWEPKDRRYPPVLSVPVKKGKNAVRFVMAFIPEEQEITVTLQAGPGRYVIEKMEIARQKEDF